MLGKAQIDAAKTEQEFTFLTFILANHSVDRGIINPVIGMRAHQSIENTMLCIQLLDILMNII